MIDFDMTQGSTPVDTVDMAAGRMLDGTKFGSSKRDWLDALNAFGGAGYKVGLPLPSSKINARDIDLEQAAHVIIVGDAASEAKMSEVV